MSFKLSKSPILINGHRQAPDVIPTQLHLLRRFILPHIQASKTSPKCSIPSKHPKIKRTQRLANLGRLYTNNILPRNPRLYPSLDPPIFILESSPNPHNILRKRTDSEDFLLIWRHNSQSRDLGGWASVFIHKLLCQLFYAHVQTATD